MPLCVAVNEGVHESVAVHENASESVECEWSGGGITPTPITSIKSASFSGRR